MFIKTKECSHCKQLKPIWKNKVVDGVKLQLCQSCLPKIERSVKAKKKKERIEKNKVLRESKRLKKQYSMENLQVLFQKFTRLVTPDFCASCGSKFVGNRVKNGGHMIPKKNFKSVALLAPNIYSQCNICNSPINGGMPLYLRKYGVTVWGEGTITMIENMARVSYSFDLGERRELFDKVMEYIDKAEKIKDLKLDSTSELTSLKNLHGEIWAWQQEQTWFKHIINNIKQ